MASSEEYLEFVLEMLASVEGVTTRKMMGEYMLYLDGKVIGGIYDDELLLKPDSRLDALVSDAQHRLPYEGSKTMMLIVDSEDPAFVSSLVEAVRP